MAYERAMRLNRRAVIAGLLLPPGAAPALAVPARGATTFPAEDGVPVTGRVHGAGRHAVLLVPGAHGVGETWELQARRLARAGLRVLAMDYRGLGDARGTAQDGDKTHLDVLGAARRLRRDGATRIAAVGASWGGRAAAMASIAAPGLIDRLLLLAPSPFEAPERLGGRKLFIVARGDRDGAGRPRLDSIGALHARVPAPKRLVVLEGAAHAQLLFLTDQGERLYGEMQRFLTAR